MPEYSQIQTYIKYNGDITSQTARFKSVFTQIGFDEKYLSDSFSGLKWDPCDGFMCSCNTEPERINLFGKMFNIRPLVSGWTSQDLKELNEPWLAFYLLFETEEITVDYQSLKIDVQIPLWNVMVLVSKCFRETGVYFTNELTDGTPWEALLGCNHDIWSFDAAIIPAGIANHYNELPNDFLKKETDEGLYFINKAIWSEVPW